ncbi:hypothetical protein MNBD_GAMMA16-2122 [hydrothermal vent metagenome]|uniref:DUF481 domain-containing protein n=1 Tax=hydrothermal vent metagenome TaxID=652676 RepID=A0A3B0ZC86_9ZZZZ
MIFRKSGCAAALFLLAGNTAYVNASNWSGEAELGLVVTTGNTETQSVNAKTKVINERASWRHTFVATALSTADEIRTTSEKYFLSGQSDYKFSEFDYFFGIVSYEDDRFSGYEYQVSEVLGYGRRVIHEPSLTLDLEGGPGARQSKIIDGDSDNELIVRLGANLEWKISDSASFSEKLSTEIGEDTTITKSITALKAQIVGSLAMKVSLTIKHTSEVPANSKKTDSETALTLVYSF